MAYYDDLIKTLRARIHELADSTPGQWEQQGLPYEARERFLNQTINEIIAAVTNRERER